MKVYKLNTKIDVGEYKGYTVEEALNMDKKSIFGMIKEFKLNFDDEVLAIANITRIIRDRKVVSMWDKHEDCSKKKYKKDISNIEKIMDEIDDERHKLIFDEDSDGKPEEKYEEPSEEMDINNFDNILD